MTRQAAGGETKSACPPGRCVLCTRIDKSPRGLRKFLVVPVRTDSPRRTRRFTEGTECLSCRTAPSPVADSTQAAQADPGLNLWLALYLRENKTSAQDDGVRIFRGTPPASGLRTGAVPGDLPSFLTGGHRGRGEAHRNACREILASSSVSSLFHGRFESLGGSLPERELGPGCFPTDLNPSWIGRSSSGAANPLGDKLAVNTIGARNSGFGLIALAARRPASVSGHRRPPAG
jgi:hypothetical protein